MTYLALFLACGLGALLRYGFSVFFESSKDKFPWATLAANLLACFLLGYLSKKALSPNLYPILASGFCGGLSTFSTLELDSFQLKDKPVNLITYWFLSYGLGWGLLILGQHLAT